jgi:hypothetical protein
MTRFMMNPNTGVEILLSCCLRQRKKKTSFTEVVVILHVILHVIQSCRQGCCLFRVQCSKQNIFLSHSESQPIDLFSHQNSYSRLSSRVFLFNRRKNSLRYAKENVLKEPWRSSLSGSKWTRILLPRDSFQHEMKRKKKKNSISFVNYTLLVRVKNHEKTCKLCRKHAFEDPQSLEEEAARQEDQTRTLSQKHSLLTWLVLHDSSGRKSSFSAV